MGIAQVTCVSGCTCRPNWADGFWDSATSLTQMHAFKVGGGGWRAGGVSAGGLPGLRGCSHRHARGRAAPVCHGAPPPPRRPAPPPSLPAALRRPLQASQHPRCRVRVTVVERSRDDKGRAALKAVLK